MSLRQAVIVLTFQGKAGEIQDDGHPTTLLNNASVRTQNTIYALLTITLSFSLSTGYPHSMACPKQQLVS